MHCLFRDDAGSVTAEFAIALPAVVLMLALCLSGVQAAGQHLRVQDAAAVAARSISRGESVDGAADRAAWMVAGASLSTGRRGDLECVTVTAPTTGLIVLTVSASSCALADGG